MNRTCDSLIKVSLETINSTFFFRKIQLFIKIYYYPKSIYNLFTSNIFSEISSIEKLEFDPYLHGAGLHAHPKYGRLNMHLDYEKHPKL